MKRGFYTIMTAQFFSSLADNALFVVAVELLRSSHAPEWQRTALVPMFALFYVVLAPFVGAFADAKPKGRVMFMSNAIKVLGCLLMDSACFDAVGPVLVADDFYHPEHRGIFTTVAELVQSGKVADVITVFERGAHDLAELNALAMSVPSTRNAGQYAATVRDLSVRRQVVEVASDLAESVYLDMQRKQATHELIDAAMVKLLALMAGRQARQPKVVADLVPPFLQRLDRLASPSSQATASASTRIPAAADPVSIR